MPADAAIAMEDLNSQMMHLGQAARAAAADLAQCDPDAKNRALRAAAAALRDGATGIQAANDADMVGGEAKGLTPALLDRLKLTDDRIEAMAAGLEAIAEFPDPIGRELAGWERPNGLRITRVSVPLGVIGIIYESRPNVTADAGGLCLKSGNAAILRGGSESAQSSGAILECLQHGLEVAGLPRAAIQCPPTQDRAAVGILLTMSDSVDVIIPRGGRGLIERIRNESKVPVMSHLDGLCHTYVHRSADLEMAREIVLNAKMRRVGICGATETLLVDQDISQSHLPKLLADLTAKGCEIRGDESVLAVARDHGLPAVPASASDWDTEYLAPVLSVRMVDGLEAAIGHINRHGSHHTEAIIADDPVAAVRFSAAIDAGIVMHNTSTQFADGGEFGMGAEIGISTGKLHARGPVGADQLTSYKYLVSSPGRARP
ncbi:MAG: glutamate-5-semialdehyde dehydrogenase [Pseudomonadota bacterium]